MKNTFLACLLLIDFGNTLFCMESATLAPHEKMEIASKIQQKKSATACLMGACRAAAGLAILYPQLVVLNLILGKEEKE